MSRMDPMPPLRADTLTATRPAAAAPKVTTKIKADAVSVFYGEKQALFDVSLDMPENLTTWRIKVWGLGHGTRVGEGRGRQG